MHIQCDTLKYATILKQRGLKSSDAGGLMSTLTEIEIFNIHSKQEIDNMLSQSVREIFAEQDKKLAEQRREFDEQLREQRAESLTSRRWMIGTIITVGLSLAAYLSALIHFNH